MDNKINEEQVLEILGIEDFRHLSKEKVIQFASMIQNMQPEVAIKALEQFPEFAKTIIELATDYKCVIDAALQSNSETMKSYSEILGSIIEQLKVESNKENLSFEEKQYYIGKMLEVATMLDKKDSENKQFIIKSITIAGTIVVALLFTAISALGGNIDINIPGQKNKA